MTWAFAVGQGRRIFARSALAASLVLGAAAACSAGSPNQTADDDDSSTAGTGGAGVSGAAGVAGAGVAGAGVAGASGSAGTGGGTAGSGPVTLTITPSNGCATPFAMDLGQTHLEVDPTHGGRITVLKASGVDILANQTVTGDMVDWGSTFWPSPQKWPWPPTATTSIPEIDANAYSCPAADAASFTVQSSPTTSGLTTVPKISVSKKFYADTAKEAVIIDYTVTNTGTAAVDVAPWEISRVPGGALSFYGAASAPTKKSGNFALPPTSDIMGVTWYQHNPADATQYKLFADGAGGWLAAVVNGTVFVKKFADVPANAQPATEAEIELYSAAKYVEVEAQGALQTIAVGASITWTVRWFARPLPAGASATAGDPNLLAFVQSLVQ